ncbi:MAG: FYDLN acid domain-containing protein [Deltaproteobacteria bacterium]|nr:MAG: FYDLN acid domain-containing protein [Deltaproteobacteria bacterium]
MAALRKRAARKKAKRPPEPPRLNSPGLDRRASLGTKHECPECGAKFYDMNKPEPLCPRCGADPRSAVRTPPLRATAAIVAKPRAAGMDRYLDSETSRDARDAGVDDDDDLDLDVSSIDEDALDDIDDAFEDDDEDPD